MSVNFDDLDDLDPEAYQGASLSLGERLRLHEVSEDQVRLAAFLGDAEALALEAGSWTPSAEAAGLSEVEAVLREGGLEPAQLQRAAADAAARVLDLAEVGPEGAVLRRCVRVAQGVELLDAEAVEALLEEAYALASREGAGSAALACATSARTVLGGPLAGAAAAKTFALALEACEESDAERERDWQRSSLIGLVLAEPEAARAGTVFGSEDAPTSAEEGWVAEEPAGEREERGPELPADEAFQEARERAPDAALQETRERAPDPALQETRERAPNPALQETRERAPAPLASTLERPAPLFPSSPGAPAEPGGPLGSFSYDDVPDDPFAAREAASDWRENPWIQGGFCIALALVLAFVGTVPIALAGAALAVALLWPIVPKLAELCALVLGSCLFAFFLFEFLQKITFLGLLRTVIAFGVGWGPISAYLQSD